MTRKKVRLAYITSDSKRKATFRKRKNGLIKKVDEISTLCGIEACAIIFGPTDPQPEVWPSAYGVQRVLSRFRTMPQMEQSKKMLNQESFLKQRIVKGQEQLKKQTNDNIKKEMTHLMFQYLNAGQVFGNVSTMDLNYLSWLIDQNLKEIEQKMNEVQAQEVVESGGEQANMGDAEGQVTNVEAMKEQPWSMDFSNFIGGELPFEDVDDLNGLLA